MAARTARAICKVSDMAPDECIPCLAFAIVADRIEAEKRDEEEEDEQDVVNEKLVNLFRSVPPWTESDLPTDMTPVAEQFASKVAELSLLVEELLDGPPIPPPDVTLEDLALLVLAADKWVKMSEIQGGLAPAQEQMLDATRNLVARLRHE